MPFGEINKTYYRYNGESHKEPEISVFTIDPFKDVSVVIKSYGTSAIACFDIGKLRELIKSLIQAEHDLSGQPDGMTLNRFPRYGPVGGFKENDYV